MRKNAKKKPLVLAMDDEPNITAGIKRTLTRAGYEVIELNNPFKLEDFLLHADLDLIITDLYMPRRDGLDVLRMVKTCNPDLPVLILTGHGTTRAVHETTKLGAVRFLYKPLTDRELIEAVAKFTKPTQESTPGGVQE